MLTALCDFLSHAVPALAASCARDPNSASFKAENDQFIRWVSDMIATGLQIQKEAHVFGATKLLQVSFPPYL